jgi:hypothetical protein
MQMSCLLFDTYVTFGLVTWMACNSPFFGGSLFARTWVLPPCPFSPPICLLGALDYQWLACFHHLTSSSYVLIYMHITLTHFLHGHVKHVISMWVLKVSEIILMIMGQSRWPIAQKNRKRVLECITTI